MTRISIRNEDGLHLKVIENLGATHRLNRAPKCVIVSGLSHDIAERFKKALAKYGYILEDRLMNGQTPSDLSVLFLSEAAPEELSEMLAKNIRSVLLLDDGVDEYLNLVSNAVHIVYNENRPESEFSDYEHWVFEQLREGKKPGDFSEDEFLAGKNKGEVV
jgi:hypothetical protein